MLVGIASGVPGGSEVIVIAAVYRVDFDLAAHEHAVACGMVGLVFAKSNGPAFAGTSNVTPNGAQPGSPTVHAPLPL